jgi:hypothetical protein
LNPNIAAVIISCIALFGSIGSWVYRYGKMDQNMKDFEKNFEEDCKEFKESLTDLTTRVNAISRNLASLEGSVNMFMDFVRKNHGKK